MASRTNGCSSGKNLAADAFGHIHHIGSIAVSGLKDLNKLARLGTGGSGKLLSMGVKASSRFGDVKIIGQIILAYLEYRSVIAFYLEVGA